MKILVFIGPKQAGKDTSAGFLISAKKATGRIAFADPLKSLCSEIFNVNYEYFIDPQLKEKPFENPIPITRSHLKGLAKGCVRLVSETNESGEWKYNIDRFIISDLEGVNLITPRHMLQFVGTDIIRERIYKEWHLEAAFGKKARAKLSANGVYCVTDARFLNEFQFLKTQFGDKIEFYYIQRPQAEQELAKASHPSELEILEIKERIPAENIIENSGSLKDLEERILKIKPKKR